MTVSAHQKGLLAREHDGEGVRGCVGKDSRQVGWGTPEKVGFLSPQRKTSKRGWPTSREVIDKRGRQNLAVERETEKQNDRRNVKEGQEDRETLVKNCIVKSKEKSTESWFRKVRDENNDYVGAKGTRCLYREISKGRERFCTKGNQK